MNKRALSVFVSFMLCMTILAQEAVLTANFTGGLCGFSVVDVSQPVSGTPVWTQSKDYGMVASGFTGGKNYASEGWLISPTIDLQELSNSRLNISHALNFFSSLDKAKEETTVYVRVVGEEWVEIKDLCYPAKLSWNFIDCEEIDLSRFDGKCIQLGFRYVSTATKAGTWEVKQVEIIAETGKSTINGLSELADMADGTLFTIDFSEDDPGMIDYSGVVEGSKTSSVVLGVTEAYLHDKSGGSVMLRNFLPQDAGWHTASGGTVIGKLEGRYVIRNGMPGIEHTKFSKADNMLCLDDMFEPQVTELSVAEASQAENLARYVSIPSGKLQAEEFFLTLVDGDASVQIDNRYGTEGIDLSQLELGQSYHVTGVLGGFDDEDIEASSTTVLHLLSVETVTTAISAIDNTPEDTKDTGNVYDLQGRKVAEARHAASLQPGIYIKNGKKFIVRR